MKGSGSQGVFFVWVQKLGKNGVFVYFIPFGCKITAFL